MTTTATNGGQFPAMSGYDMASGLGTPVASQIANGLMGIPLAVAVSGSQPYGATPTFTASANYAGTGTLPFGVTGLNTSGLSCTTVGASTPISPTLTAGAYTLMAGTSCSGATLSGANKGDYTIVYTSAANDFTVNPAPLVITASSPTMPYASAVPTITPLYAGLQNGQSATSTPPTCSTTATSSSPVSGSPYPSSCTGASDPNYAISYLPGSVTIAPAQIFVAASGTQTYGGAPSFSGTDSAPSGVTVDTSGLSCSQVDSSISIAPGLPAGPHALVPLSCSGAILSGPNAGNYAPAYTSAAGDFTVTPAPLTITASNVIATYGGSVPSVVAGYSGLKNGETRTTAPPTCSTTATSSSPVAGSPYPSTCSGAVDPNYTITYVPGLVTVNPAPLVITASSPTMPYASAVPTITPLYAGLQNGQSATSTPPTCSTTATSSSPVSGSPYPSSCTGASDPNYAISYLPGSVTIAPAQIFVAASGTQTYGGAPSFSGTDSAPSGVTVDTSGLSCSQVDSSISIAPGLPAGPHALVPLSCSGAILSGPNAGNYAPAYTERGGGLHGHPGSSDHHCVDGFHELRRGGAERGGGVHGLRQR